MEENHDAEAINENIINENIINENIINENIINDILNKKNIYKKEIPIIKYNPDKLYSKYTNINCVKYTNENGDLFKCLEYSNFDYKLVNKLLFNLHLTVIKNLYRFIWINFKLFKENIKNNWSIYEKDETYEYIMNYNLLHYKDYYKSPDYKKLFLNYHNFVYNNLHTENEILSIYFYNMICKYLI